MGRYIESFWGILVEIAPSVLIGMLGAGLVHEALGRFQRLRSFALKRSVWSLSFFNFAGFTLPICSCGVIPLAVGLRNQGVPFGNIFAFVFSAPATSIAAAILCLAVLGPRFALYYVTGAILCGYVIGLAFYAAEHRSRPLPGRKAVSLCADGDAGGSTKGFFLRAMHWGTITYGGRISFDLMVGLALAALLVTTYPPQTLGTWVADQPFWLAALVVMSIAIPMYVCSLPGIMVAGALVLAGFTPGLVWIFLMAGPVTNLGDINVLRRNVGWRSTLLYVTLVVVMTFLWGAVIHHQLQWEDIWVHVREYYATQPGLGGDDAATGAALASSGWLGLPREIHYAAAILLAYLTLHGGWNKARQFWLNPCLDCRHFQDDMHLDPSICVRPCWKRRLLAFLKSTRFSRRRRAWASIRRTRNNAMGSGIE
jgi:uncharacterized protein